MLSICRALEVTPDDLFYDVFGLNAPTNIADRPLSKDVELLRTFRQLTPALRTQLRRLIKTLADREASEGPISASKSVDH